MYKLRQNGVMRLLDGAMIPNDPETTTAELPFLSTDQAMESMSDQRGPGKRGLRYMVAQAVGRRLISRKAPSKPLTGLLRTYRGKCPVAKRLSKLLNSSLLNNGKWEA